MSIKNLEDNNPTLEDDELYQDDYLEDYDEYLEGEDGEYYDDDDSQYFEEEQPIEERPRKSIFSRKKFQSDNEYDDDDDYEDDDEYDDDDDDYEEEERPKRKVKRKIKGLRLSLALIMIFIILGVAALLSTTIIFLAKEYLGVDKSTTTYIVEIPEGASTDEIIDILYDNNLIKVKELFKLAIKLNSGDEKPLVAGEHQISPSMDYGDMIDELKTNIQDNKDVVTITFPEGINVYDAATMLQQEGVCDARNFIYYFNGGFDLSEYKFNNYLPVESTLKFLKLEGYLFPDTYEFYKDEEPEIVARKIFDNFDKKITDNYYTQMQNLNMTLDEVITLASIVQKEAGNVADMKKISSVFHNRLDNPDTFPMLQSDPTRIYAEEVIHENLDVSNVTMEEAYNTYKSAGLPPGAICNPGLHAIEAVLYPDTTNYFYFCADVENGITYYASTNEEHEANLELAGISLED
ncbi:MAG: endolytic transglycosylase MltG [Oscillospiraceae bacterium]